jgi:23S rRNA (cytidine2498-2'-O)-methyltransferase
MSAEPHDDAGARFVFATCQSGAEGALKREVARRWPSLRLAFSRPGFVTFKAAGDAPPDALRLRAVFARSSGLSLGPAEGDSPQARAHHALRAAAERGCPVVHVYQRDLAPPGVRGFEPGTTPASHQAEALLRTAAERLGTEAIPPAPPRRGRMRADRQPGLPLRVQDIAAAGERVLDCILVEPELWWLGTHRGGRPPACWPGGFCPAQAPPDAVSRAWLKIEEAILWSGLPLAAGQRCAEIGCAPGGSVQALLARGLHVLGIDPAEVDPRVAGHPNFTHLRKRGADVRRREFRKVRWLTADLNVAPAYTLDTVEAIVTHPEVNVRGLILMLKLLDWALADEVPEYVARVGSWGYRRVAARQLQHNRQEVCLAARR